MKIWYYLFLLLFFVNFFAESSVDNNYKIVDAASYHSKNQSFKKFLSWTNEKQKTAQEILKIVGDKKDSLLDIGAGDGTLTRLLADNFDHVTAIEPSSSLFETLKQTCNHDKYTLVNQPFESVSLEKKFDVILVSFALQYIPDYAQEIVRMKDLLKDSGILLVIEIDQVKSELDIFHRKYRKDVLGTNSSEAVSLAFGDLLKKTFNVQEITFSTRLSIPSVDDAMSIFDFIYDTEFSKMNQEALVKIEAELRKEYADGPLKFNNPDIMYICSK